ncbi:hypothetical protein [Mesobacillus selenatarsenatis]|uniref:Uncharacterized protein n=1 Tax=Mesobacillus selenatarsenatis (strain DSM 18680 / JCM 14380 / FERM P-15431 / SF-1) TaxID=1321606 RepID=A0A0A8X724_MESS1|nr:hypothetical protein [Mesobacillus selenatarsenatis]GAM15733.1 hypothetical protein SAMD00020551_3891 [Mesobacillus selenatarsenatis SF-1]
MNNIPNLHFGNAALHTATKPISLETLMMNGDTYFKIENYSQMNPFFMTVVSDVDLWMFISSTGGLTCGRKNAETALFPYDTDDKIHDSIETTGSHTILIVNKDEKNFLWKPFSLHNSDVYKITRNLYKNTIGNKIMFEEINHDLEVSYTYTWKSSDLFGFIKESRLFNLAEKEVEIRVLDGIRNILPYGVNTLLQTTKSTLVDGYKRNELVEKAGLGIYTLSSILTDKAEPSESLKATTVWSKGLENPSYLLSELQIKAFSHNEEIQTEVDIKGRRGSYYVVDSIHLKGNESKNWFIVAELNQSASKVEKLMKEVMENPSILEVMEADVTKGDNNLKKLVYDADGFQCTANEKAGYRHFSNTLYNIMRGGIYADGYEIDREDFKAFVGTWNKEVYTKQLDFMNQLPETINYSELIASAAELHCKDFERLVFEYLPLTYSRRHGDPSRPWNKFSIEIAKEDGSKDLKFEGNWRDIFQNWEALSISYPEYTESIIAKFVNASTADGYNPYRITKDGIDWEKLDPEDPWSNIGYWGDHQIIYLLKLMELSKAYHPEKLHELLHKDIFVYANVPYRIKGFDALVADPRNTIVYDEELEQLIEDKTASLGSDGKLVFNKDGIYKVNLLEKLLVTLLAKFSNYVPEGGIWLNTQRPEWNDANNALVGNGLSMVTLYYVHRFQNFMGQIVKEMKKDSIEVSVEVHQMFHDTLAVLNDSTQYLDNKMSDETRFSIVKALGKIGEAFRNSIYDNGFAGEKAALSIETLTEFIEVSMIHLKDSIKKNKREDGLYHSYNLIRFEKESCSVSYLYEMLEGQVSVLSSKALDGKETLDVLEALRKSPIYREDQNSYMLYPNRELPKFLEKNVIPEDQVMSSTVLKAELNQNTTRFIEKDVNGKYHFNGQFRNGEEIREALKATKEYKDEDIKIVAEIFTNLFDHHAFTGRSGTFYKYEGLGSIYWHMVSKLVLATQENFEDLSGQQGLTEKARALMNYYEDLKAGIGLEKPPEQYGAFPTDAYSHTPGFAGVQQPGMTGQVKEDFISRLGELGVKAEAGLIHFKPELLAKAEFLTEAKTWSLPRNSHAEDSDTIQLDENSLGFTFCAVPVIYYLAGKKKIIVCYKDGTERIFEDTDTLDSETSQTIFSRDGRVERIKVYIDGSKLN